MKRLLLFFTFSFFTFFVFSQSLTKELVKEGVRHHDNGDYKKAIESYKKALKINSKSTLVHYELSLSYFSNGDYKKSVKHATFVIDQNADHLVAAYMTKGSALDMMGKTKESIKLFEKALRKTEKHYLLYYNLGVNYKKINDYDNAEKNIMKAIEVNPNHGSSHIMLASIHNEKGNAVQALLAAHYFLLLEPNTSRSQIAYKILQKNFGGNVSKGKNNTINIMISGDTEDEFSAIQLMISMLQASKNLDENKDKTDDEMFVKNTTSFFKMLGEMKKKKSKGIWWEFYTPFFYELAKTKHMESYCKYITQSGNKASKEWLGKNQNKLESFDSWLQKK